MTDPGRTGGGGRGLSVIRTTISLRPTGSWGGSWELHGLDRRHPAVEGAAGVPIHTPDLGGGLQGDLRRPVHTELLRWDNGAARQDGLRWDGRAERVLHWLLSISQDNEGWALPFQTVGARLDHASMASGTLEPDPSKPFSHQVTGVVLRAFAAYDEYRGIVEAREAGVLLASSLFRRGRYPGRQGAEYWTKFTFPFWFTDLLSALDSLS